MSLNSSPISNKHRMRWMHWLVLWSLVLGQLAMSTGLTLAQTPSSHSTKVPVCTSTGIVYVTWSEAATKQISEEHQTLPSTESTTHAGTCVWCTVSPTQLRFDLHKTLLPHAQSTEQINNCYNDSFTTPAFNGNPHAAPRAPPLCLTSLALQIPAGARPTI